MSATDGASHHDGRPPLSVATDLDVSIDGTPVSVRSTGDRLLVDVPTLAAGVDALGGVPRSEVPAAAAALEDADLTVELRVRESPVAVVGADASPGALSDRMGVAPAALRVGGAAVAAGRGVTAALGAARRLAGALTS
ncbi:hypothetical protein PNQ29_04145 [Halobacterium salinarum]|uniref:Uncharacterized protein n=4 Tax=Halobacterium salinarum TaxID=2242 RepID=A0A510N6L3_HALSA|nr:hypothetical protein [Halobacterium salinarum]MBB6090348.1 hypothetical protein [Halobacterium salinarum]MDL0118932.1 hypothetical protein [Halobacterium salinarum]MDL0126161.1 hypothetical protein [Halobacterium salinarum]MDL0130976.1 hypothetical protein [Halobacterium salinarum]MDL0145760.1 hypothetical protein [Halobacterium salinarum]